MIVLRTIVLVELTEPHIEGTVILLQWVIVLKIKNECVYFSFFQIHITTKLYKTLHFWVFIW